MYKSSNDFNQRRARQIWLGDLQQDGFLDLTPEQQRQCLVAKIKAIDAQIIALPKGENRSELGKIKQEICLQINAIRPKFHGSKDALHHLFDLVKEEMPKLQFMRLWDEANRRARVEKEQA